MVKMYSFIILTGASLAAAAGCTFQKSPSAVKIINFDEDKESERAIKKIIGDLTAYRSEAAKAGPEVIAQAVRGIPTPVVTGANELFEESIDTLAAMIEDERFGQGPYVSPSGFLYKDLVTAPTNNVAFVHWQTVLSSNPFDLAGLTDPSAVLVQIEKFQGELMKPEAKKVGWAAFLTLSAPDLNDPLVARKAKEQQITEAALKKFSEVRGVCSDFLKEGGALDVDVTRQFRFKSATFVNRDGQQATDERRSPVFDLIRPQMSISEFEHMVAAACGPVQEDENASGDESGLAQNGTDANGTYSIVTAFNVGGDVYRILKGTGKITIPGGEPSELTAYWLQKSISFMPERPSAD